MVRALDDTPATPEENLAASLRRMIQRQPHTYRWFGAWWWPLKRVLRDKYGYDLGPNDEPEVAVALMNRAGNDPARVLRLALLTYRRNVGGHTDGEYEHNGRTYFLNDDEDLIAAGLNPFG